MTERIIRQIATADAGSIPSPPTIPNGEREDAAVIGLLYQKSRNSLVESVEFALQCGQCLTAKKASLPHGGWLPWLADNAEVLGFGDRTARRLLELAAIRSSTTTLDEAGALAISRKLWGNDSKKSSSKIDLKAQFAWLRQRLDAWESFREEYETWRCETGMTEAPQPPAREAMPHKRKTRLTSISRLNKRNKNHPTMVGDPTGFESEKSIYAAATAQKKLERGIDPIEERARQASAPVNGLEAEGGR